jgi:trimeric autotransporter adhesin
MRHRSAAVVIGLFIAIPSALSAQSILTIAGGGTDDARPATMAGLNGPSGVALDSVGNLYIADQYNSRIRRVAAGSGIVTTVAGNGSEGFSGDGGAATAAALFEPSGVALDSAANLYIADFSNHRIRKVAAGSGIITTVAGNGSESFSGDGGAATAAGLRYPEGVALDSAGNLYIAEWASNRIRKVAARSGIITTVAGNGSFGFSGDGGAATAAGLFSPSGVALDSAGNLYIADWENHRIRKVAAESGIITTVAGNGSQGFSGDGGAATAAGLNYPTGVAMDSEGNLYIADYGNNRIRKVAAGSGIITTVAGNDSRGFSGDGGAATAAGLDRPYDVAMDSEGNLYIADTYNNRIRKVAAANGIITTVAGNGSNGMSSGDSGAATAATLSGPNSVVLDSAGNLYIADYGNHRIRRVAAGSGIITTVAGNGSLGFSGDGGAATAAGLSYPIGVALDSAGNLYIADFSNHRIRKVAAGSGIITTVAGNGSPGFSGDGGAATAAALYWPGDVALDSAGNLYIAEEGNNRIRRVATGSGIITTVAGNGSQGFSGDGGAATAAALSHVHGVALDPAGNLYVADSGNNRIRKVEVGSGIITTVAGSGSTGFGGGFSGDGGAATAAGLYWPFGVALDSAGNLNIADTGNFRIRKVAGGSGIITTVAGNGFMGPGGRGGFSGDGGPATAAELNIPVHVALDSAGNLYETDEDSNRVRAVYVCLTVLRPDLTVPSDGVHGVSSSAKLGWKPVQGAFTYDVYLGKTNPPQKIVASDISATSYPASNQELGATYYWKVVVKGDRFCPSPSTASSEVRSFTTAEGCGPASFN